jgi:hypothetical protein
MKVLYFWQYLLLMVIVLFKVRYRKKLFQKASPGQAPKVSKKIK